MTSGRNFRWQVYYGKMLREKYISSGRTEYFPVGNATGKKTGLPVGISAQRSTTGKSYRKWLPEIISAYRCESSPSRLKITSVEKYQRKYATFTDDEKIGIVEACFCGLRNCVREKNSSNSSERNYER